MPNSIPEQAVILAAGENTRFEPFRRARHKGTFSVFGEPLIVQTIRSLAGTGVKRIEIIKSPRDLAIKKLIETSDIKVPVFFHDQKEPLGGANAILESGVIPDERFLLINSQQINVGEHLKFLDKGEGVVLFGQTTDEPQKYGMLKLEGGRVKGVVEKPEDITGLSDKRVLGIYILTKDFTDFLKTIQNSQYQFEDGLDKYSREKEVFMIESKEPALSLKYVWDLFDIIHYRFSKIADKAVSKKGCEIAPSAILRGPVIIEEGAKIFDYAIIDGPCYIGRNAIVGSYCKVGKESVLEEGVELQNAVQVKHSLIGKNTHIHSGYIGDSIIGEDVRIGAGFITANRRLDRGDVGVQIKGETVDTKSSYFGALIGDRVKIGIHSGTNPGAVIKEETIVMPGTIFTR